MKKSKLFLTAALAVCYALVGISCASKPVAEANENGRQEPSFTKNYEIAPERMYSVNDYLEGRYRSNFVNIPQDELVDSKSLDSKNAFSWKVGVFTLDGNKVYLGWNNYKVTKKDTVDGKEVKTTMDYPQLGLWDEDFHSLYSFLGSKDSEKSYFRYENNTGTGIVTEIELKGKKYVVAIAGRNSDIDGFRMWVEDSLPTDKADTATDQYSLKNYDWADIWEGVYKPGYKRIWGKYTTEDIYRLWYAEGFKIKKYNYNGVDFLIGGTQDGSNCVRTLDGKKFEPASKTYFHIMYGNKGKREMSWGLCYEGKIQIGDKKVTMAVILCNGDNLVFIKE